MICLSIVFQVKLMLYLLYFLITFEICFSFKEKQVKIMLYAEINKMLR